MLSGSSDKPNGSMSEWDTIEVRILFEITLYYQAFFLHFLFLSCLVSETFVYISTSGIFSGLFLTMLSHHFFLPCSISIDFDFEMLPDASLHHLVIRILQIVSYL